MLKSEVMVEKEVVIVEIPLTRSGFFYPKPPLRIATATDDGERRDSISEFLRSVTSPSENLLGILGVF